MSHPLGIDTSLRVKNEDYNTIKQTFTACKIYMYPRRHTRNILLKSVLVSSYKPRFK